MRRFFLAMAIAMVVMAAAGAVNLNSMTLDDSTRTFEVVTLTTAEVVYTMTFPNSSPIIVDYTLMARGGDIIWQGTTSTTEANLFLTIPEDAAAWPTHLTRLASSEEWYFRSHSSNVTIECQYTEVR